MKLGVVVIGRNEGDRLARCLDSLTPERIPVVYVDSGSTDASVSVARSRGVEVVELDPVHPFSAARARNEGFARCRDRHPDLSYIMFVDGDCEVVAGWLDRAARELDARPELAIVCGRRRELHPERSVYNRLADLEWATPIGLAASCGGDALVRIADFEAVDGFDPTARAGEEPELCQRLRQRQRLIARIDTEMTRHDLNMTRFSEWWRRQYRVGYHGLDIETRFPPTPPGPSLFGANLRRARIWGLGWPVGTVILAVSGWWVAGGLGLVGGLILALLVLVAQAARLARRLRPGVESWTDAAVGGILSVFEKWANLAGQIQYRRDRWRGHEAQLIEYKTATIPAAVPRAG